MKYTKEILETPIRESKSYTEVLRRLGLQQCGSTQRDIIRCVQQLRLDTSHFLEKLQSNGKPKRLHWKQILVRCRTVQREDTNRLRRAMLESGILYCCSICHCSPEWQGHPLILQIDHLDGDFLNNEPDNVRFLCPNCHSQTPNFGSKNINRLSELDFDELSAWTGEDL